MHIKKFKCHIKSEICSDYCIYIVRLLNQIISQRTKKSNMRNSSYRGKKDLTEEQVQTLQDVFRQNLPPNKERLNLTEFKKLMPSKNVKLPSII